MLNIYYNNKVITSQSCCKNSKLDCKSITLSPFFLESEAELFSLFEKYDTIYITEEDENRVIEILNKKLTTIIAAGGVVRNCEDKVLMIYRNGKWDLPKGKMEKGEKVEECAVREVEEECGVTSLELQELTKVSYHIYHLKDKNIFKTTYWYNMRYEKNEYLVAQIEEGITKVEWVAECDIDKRLENSYPNIIDVLRGC